MSTERQRTAIAQKLMQSRCIDALVIFSPQNIRYLTAFSQACEVVIVPAKGEPTLLGLWLDVASAKGQTWIKDIRSFIPHYTPRVDGGRNELSKVAEVVKNRGLARGTLGVEMGYLRYRQLEMLKSDLPSAQFEDVSGMLAEMRVVKSDQEIDLIKKSIEIAEAAMRAAVKALKTGVAEAEIAAEASREIERRGAEVASRTMVASGSRTLQIHPYPTIKKISKDELVTIDVHAKYEGYCSDIARTCVIGSASKEQKSVFEALLKAQSSAFEAMRPGVGTRAVMDAVNKVLDKAGYIRHFPELYGHGVGLDVEDLPKVAAGWEINLSPNMPIALFQGPIALPKVGGVRLEDIALVTKVGSEILTRYPRELIEV